MKLRAVADLCDYFTDRDRYWWLRHIVGSFITVLLVLFAVNFVWPL